MKFYNMKKRANVEIPESQCKKIVYKSETSKGVRARYAVRAVDSDGTHLTKFMKEADYKALNCPEGDL